MKRTLTALILLLVAGPMAPGVDLTKIERTVGKEPVYQGKPLYGLLVFGPEAKNRAWVVLNGETLYVDRNCNGDLSEPGERFVIKKLWALNPDKAKPGKWTQGDDVAVQVTEPDGTKHQLTFRCTATGIGLGTKARGGQYVGATYREDLVLADAPKDAPIVHLGGPFTFVVAQTPKTVAPGENFEFVALFGTPGLGKATFAYPIQSFSTRPLAEVQFPPKKPGDPPQVVQVRLGACSRPGFIGG